MREEQDSGARDSCAQTLFDRMWALSGTGRGGWRQAGTVCSGERNVDSENPKRKIANPFPTTNYTNRNTNYQLSISGGEIFNRT